MANLTEVLRNLSQAVGGLLHATNGAQYGSSPEWVDAYKAAEEADALLHPTCPECGASLEEEVSPFSECLTCEKRDCPPDSPFDGLDAAGNDGCGIIFPIDRPAPEYHDKYPTLSQRLAESIKDDRRVD